MLFYEQRIIAAFKACLSCTLGYLRERLAPERPSFTLSSLLLREELKYPLFAVKVKIIGSEIVLDPPLNAIEGVTREVVRAVIRTCHSFKRWGYPRTVRLLSSTGALSADAMVDLAEADILSLDQRHGHLHPGSFGSGLPSAPPLTLVFNSLTKKGVLDLDVNESTALPVVPNFDVHSMPRLTARETRETFLKTLNLRTIWSYFFAITRSSLLTRQVIGLRGLASSMRDRVTEFLSAFDTVRFLYTKSVDDVFESIVSSEDFATCYEEHFLRLQQVEEWCLESTVETGTGSISREAVQIGTMMLNMEDLYRRVLEIVTELKSRLGAALRDRAKMEMDLLFNTVHQFATRLQRPLEDLDDVQHVMGVLGDMWDFESRLELQLAPVEETYMALLTSYGVQVGKDEVDGADNLRYEWRKTHAVAAKRQEELASKQPEFRTDLISTVGSFKKNVDEFKEDYQKNGPMVVGLRPMVAMERLHMFQRAFEERKRKMHAVQAGERLFGIPVTSFNSMSQIDRQLRMLDKLYSLYDRVLHTVQCYSRLSLERLKPLKSSGAGRQARGADDYSGGGSNSGEAASINGLVGIALLNAIEDEVKGFQDDCSGLLSMRSWEAYQELKKTIDDFMSMLPLVRLLTTPAVQQRHWSMIEDMIGWKFRRDVDVFDLGHVLEAPLLKAQEEVEDICLGATKEAEIERKIRLIASEWTSNEFSFAEFKNRGSIVLHGHKTQELVTAMEDSLMILGSLLSNRYIMPFKKEIQDWVIKLSSAQEVVEQWVQVQSLWVYLEAVFVGGDIVKQLPREAKRFSDIDKQWTKIMTRANNQPNVVLMCVVDESLRGMLAHLDVQLEKCQKSLSGYLEAKRSIFPRFYFMSDPALLEVLGRASNPRSIQPHLKSIFQNISEVMFVEDDQIGGMISAEGEEVDLNADFLTSDANVEIWLGRLVDGMRSSLRFVLRGLASTVMDLTGDEVGSLVCEYPSQMCVLGLQLVWTRICEDAVSHSRSSRTAMSEAKTRIEHILRMLVILAADKSLSGMEHQNLEMLITVQVHQRDVFATLKGRQNVRNTSNFEWLKQTRFYWRPDLDDMIISISDVDFRYCYEYLGVSERLVRTQLTDRCYITLAQAIGMSLGGAPAGPAGTGKTETVKDMARTLGKFVVVFNCSDQMDYRGIGKIFKGLARSGVWGCFDEFNRIDLDVLSVAAQQVAAIFNARRDRLRSMVFTDGETIIVDP